MANMSHCRFENTFKDLQDCHENIDNDELSKTEQRYRKLLISLCADITYDWENYFE